MDTIQVILYLILLSLSLVELAKKNPKLHDRPAGGRSFRRIDSL